MDFEGMMGAGTMLGTTAVQVFSNHDCPVYATYRWIEFYHHESCGKCTPCREGNYWMKQVLRRILSGEGTHEDLDTLLDACDNLLGRSFCALGDGATSPVTSSIKYFKQDYLDYIEGRKQPLFKGELVGAHDDSHPGGRVPQPRTRGAQMTDVAKRTDEVTLTIDGTEVTVPKGTLIIRVAEQMGIEIPRFCDHPLLPPAGACRQCLVEVEGQRKPVTSCTTPVAEGMVVRTHLTSEVARKAQQGIMEFLLINHPLDCPMCDKGGECPLQNQAMSTGRADSRFRDVKRTYPKPINLSTQILLDRERCVQCARCTRFSEVIAGDPFIDLMDRSAAEQVNVYRDEMFGGEPDGRRRQPQPGRGGAVPLVLLRQHRPDLPGRGAHQRPVPLPRPAVRPGLHAERVRALRRRVRAAHRPPARQGDAPAGRRRPGGQRRVGLRQGPVRVPLRHRGAADHRPAGARRRRPASCGRLPGARPSPPPPRACAPPGTRAGASVCSPAAG